MEEADRSVEQVYFEVFAFLTGDLGEEQFIDEFKMAILHDVDDPAEL